MIFAALVAAVLLGTSGTWWLLVGQRFEGPAVRLTMFALLVLSIASLALITWAIGGPLKEGFVKNPSLYINVSRLGIFLVLPAVAAWRMFAVSLWKTARVDSPSAWLVLGAIVVLLGLVSGPGGMLLVLVLMIPAIVPWLAIWGLGVRLGWQPASIRLRIPIMIAAAIWGALAGYLAFFAYLYLGFHGD